MKTTFTPIRNLFYGCLLSCSTCFTFNNAQADDAELMQQFVNPTTVVVARFNVKRMALSDGLQKAIVADTKNQPLFESLKSIQEKLASFTSLFGDEDVYLTIDLPFSASQSPVRLFAKASPKFDLAALNEKLAQFRYSPAVVQGDFICTSPFQSVAETHKIAIGDDTLPALRTELPAALQSIAEHPIQILVLPPAYLWSTFRDLLPTLPAKFGGLPTSTLTDGVSWAAIGIDPALLKIQTVIQSNSTAAAQTLALQLPKSLLLASAQLSDGESKTAISTLINQSQPTVDRDRIMILFNGQQQVNQGAELVSAIFQQIVDPLCARDKMNHFRQLALAVHNYESAYKVLPPNKGARNKDGYSNFSWRVHILPFIGETELHSQFRLKEAWNSEHNSKLLEKMPRVFSSYPSAILRPNSIPVGHTTFLAPSGIDTIFGGSKPVKFSDIKDGTSNTIMLVEVKPEFAVPWTAPADYTYQPGMAAAGLATAADDHFIATFGDGSARTVPINLPNTTLIHLFQMSDGNPIDW